MRAVYLEAFDAEDPLAVLKVGERPEPEPRPGWELVQMRAASLNHHDVFSLRGVGLAAESLPMILGCDLAGLDEAGNEVVVHTMVAGNLLSGDAQGAMAELVAVPKANLLPKPAELSFEEASCLPTAWLTAYRMLFDKAALRPGETVLVQGAGGGLATALIMLGAAAGLRVWVCGREPEKRAFALSLGADAVFESGARLPERVDAVMDSVGAATWRHSLRCLKREGAMVVSGGTSGYVAEADVALIFSRHLRILGSSMGSLDELRRLLAFCASKGVTPPIDRVLPLAEARDGFAAMVAGELRGKVVLTN
ncbi:MAG: zinc-binding dehydrogenase [Solirubrobacterales bacterium]